MVLNMTTLWLFIAILFIGLAMLHNERNNQ